MLENLLKEEKYSHCMGCHKIYKYQWKEYVMQGLEDDRGHLKGSYQGIFLSTGIGPCCEKEYFKLCDLHELGYD